MVIFVQYLVLSQLRNKKVLPFSCFCAETASMIMYHFQRFHIFFHESNLSSSSYHEFHDLLKIYTISSFISKSLSFLFGLFSIPHGSTTAGHLVRFAARAPNGAGGKDGALRGHLLRCHFFPKHMGFENNYVNTTMGPFVY